MLSDEVAYVRKRSRPMMSEMRTPHLAKTRLHVGTSLPQPHEPRPGRCRPDTFLARAIITRLMPGRCGPSHACVGSADMRDIVRHTTAPQRGQRRRRHQIRVFLHGLCFGLHSSSASVFLVAAHTGLAVCSAVNLSLSHESQAEMAICGSLAGFVAGGGADLVQTGRFDSIPGLRPLDPGHVR